MAVPRKRGDEPAAGLNRSKLKLSKWAEEYERGQGKALGELERRSKREWSALYGRQERQREQLTKDCRGVLGRLRAWRELGGGVREMAGAMRGRTEGLAADECYYGQQPDAARRCDQPTMSLPHETVLLLLILIVRARLVKGVAAPLDLTGASGVGARVLLDCPTVVLCDPHDFREEQA